ncbi:MAG: carboxyl-terminal processing protease CtpC [Xenococcaceae cyanobacterium]
MVISKRGLLLGTTAIVLVGTVAVTVTGAGVHLSQSQAFVQDSPKELIDEVWQIIAHQYVDPTFNHQDWQKVRQEYLGRSYQNQAEGYKAVREMLKKLNDPYTRFMDPKEFQNMQIDTSGELTGVGIQLSKDEKTKELVVIAPIEDTPAYKAGILTKDVISKIDGKSTKGMDVNDAVNLIRGKPNTSVKITIKRKSKETEYNLTRARIQIHPVKARIENSSIGKVGYIRLNQFSAQASQEMRDAIENFEAKKVDGYILDLRSNPGGLLYSSIDIARMWLNDGTIVSTVDRKGENDRKWASSRAMTNKPLVVLVDEGSASASEILSGALQDNHRAKIIGKKTFGKGLVQSVRPLGDGSGLAVTIAKYLTPSGRDINKHGIDPDIVVDLSKKDREKLVGDRELIGTPQDPQYAKGMEVLVQTVKATKNGADRAAK